MTIHCQEITSLTMFKKKTPMAQKFLPTEKESEAIIDKNKLAADRKRRGCGSGRGRSPHRSS